MINAMGIVRNEIGPRRQEYDGFTYFGVEDGLKDDEEEEDDD